MSETEKPRRRWTGRLARAAAACVLLGGGLLLLAVALLHLPGVQDGVARWAVRRAAAALACSVEAGSVRWNLLAGTVELEEISLRGEGERAGTGIAVARARADLSVRELLRGRVVAGSVLVEAPVARLALAEDGRLLLPFVVPPSKDEGPTERADVELRGVRLERGRLELVDRGEAARRVVVGDVAVEGSLALRALASSGRVTLGGIEVSAAGREPLRGSSLSARWETRGESASATVRLTATEAGFDAGLDGEVKDLLGSPRWAATLTVRGTLGPIAERLAPALGLSGTADARVAASGAGASLSSATATGRADGLTLLGRRFDRVDLSAELDGRLLRKGTLDAARGAGRLRVEAAGTVSPELHDLRFTLRAERLDLASLVALPARAPRLAGALDGTAEGTLARPTLEGLTASVDLALRGARPAPRGALAPDGRARIRVEKGVVTAESVELSEARTRAALNGAWDVARGAFQGSLDVESPDVGPWLALFGVAGKGEVSAHLQGGGPLARPALEGSARARGLDVAGARVDALELDARSNGARFEVRDGALDAYGFTAGAEAEGTLPLGAAKTSEVDLRLRGVRFHGRPLADASVHATLGAAVEARLETADHRLSARVAFPPRGGFEASAEVDRLDLAFLGALLPPHLSGLAGELSGRVDATRPRAGALAATFRVDAAALSAGGRRFSTSGVVARVAGDVVELGSVELASDDGSRVSLSGRGRLDGTALDGRLRLEAPDLSSFAGLLAPPGSGEAPASLTGRVSADLQVAGDLPRPRVTGTVTARDLRGFGGALASLDARLAPEPGGRLAATASLAGLSWSAYRVEDARLGAVVDRDALSLDGEALGGRLRLKATGSLAGARPFDVTATLDAVDLAPFLHAAGLPAELGATTTGRVRARGTVADLRSTDVEVDLASFEATHPKWSVRADEPVRVAAEGARLDVRSLRLSGSGFHLEAKGGLPFEGRGDGHLSLDSSLDLVVLLPFIDLLDRASGRVTGRLEVGGSVASPVATGTLSVEDALLDGPDFPTPVEQLSGTLRLQPHEIRTDGVSARIGGGTVSLGGVLATAEGRIRRVDVALRARELELEAGKDVQLRASGDLAAKGDWPSPAVSGEIRLDDVVYVPSLDVSGLLKSLSARRSRAAASKETLPPFVTAIPLDVAVLARDAIHVEGNLGDAELGGNLRVKGTVGEPVVLGSIASTRGTLYFLGSSFDLSRCRVDFSDPLAIDPDLDVVATTTKGDEEITVRIDGRASKAQLLLSSSKGRSQADIVSVLVGGTTAGGSSEIAAAAARMAARGAAAPVFGALGARTDLEIVPLPTTPEGEEFLFSVGKDLGGGISATYFKGVSGETSDAIEMKWRISSRARGRLRQNQDGSLSGGFRIRHDLD